MRECYSNCHTDQPGKLADLANIVGHQALAGVENRFNSVRGSVNYPSAEFHTNPNHVVNLDGSPPHFLLLKRTQSVSGIF